MRYIEDVPTDSPAKGRYPRPSFSLEKSRHREGNKDVRAATSHVPRLAISGQGKLLMLKTAKKFPRAATILERDRYVDGLIHSCPSTDEAVKSMKEVDTVLSTGSFKIKEWICSSAVEKTSKSEPPKKTSILKSEFQPATPIVNLNNEEENKTLGVVWNPKTDVIGLRPKK